LNVKKIRKTNRPLCDIVCVNEEKVAAVCKSMQPKETILRLAATFKVLSDPTRTKIILALLKGELCVCDIASVANVSQSAISHQLRVLRNMNLVTYRKNGRIAYYSLDDKHINVLLKAGLEHIEE
jgi:ArsR family transcriptional regulator, lead/cadmium/zinc/bismuth-responsive transcriptional repressor